MATTTPNYGWAVPTSTDLVKDGATAIETLGDSIDASMFTALGTKKAGMVLLNTTSFSAVTTVNLAASTFTSVYTNYKIIVNAQIETSLQIRMRKSGTDDSSSNYVLRGRFTGADSSPATAQQWLITSATSTFKTGQTEFTLFSPFVNQHTYLATGIVIAEQAGGAAMYIAAGRHTVVDTYDACSLLFGASTTGSYQVYGYNI